MGSKGYNIAGVSAIDSDSKEVGGSIGARFPVGPGRLLAEAGRYRQTDVNGNKVPALTQFSVGYWYDLSKRTTLMANATYKKQDIGSMKGLDGKATGFENGTEENQTGVELAIRHTF